MNKSMVKMADEEKHQAIPSKYRPLKLRCTLGQISPEWCEKLINDYFVVAPEDVFTS